jgi:hypothetical protein
MVSIVEHAVAVRIATIVLLMAAAGLAASSYMSGRGKAADTKAAQHVQAAVGAAEAWFQDPYGGSGSFTGLDPARLAQEAPAVSPHVHVTVLAHGAAFCLDDEEASGHSAYYVGGRTAKVANLRGAATRQVVLVHSTLTTAAAVCANAS